MIAARRATVPNSTAVSLALVTMTLVAVLSSGCGDDSSTTDDLGVPSLPRSSPEQLLSVYMERVFASRDSIGVEDMLHEDFSCYTILEYEDADSLRDILGGDDFFCGRGLYLQYVGSLFRDSTITGINLNVLINDDHPSTDASCPDCRQVNTICTTRIAEMGDDNEPVVRVADDLVTFYVTRDPRDARQWVIWKQISRSPGPWLLVPQERTH
jgi:hypothetical protein